MRRRTLLSLLSIILLFLLSLWLPPRRDTEPPMEFKEPEQLRQDLETQESEMARANRDAQGMALLTDTSHEQAYHSALRAQLTQQQELFESFERNTAPASSPSMTGTPGTPGTPWTPWTVPLNYISDVEQVYANAFRHNPITSTSRLQKNVGPEYPPRDRREYTTTVPLPPHVYDRLDRWPVPHIHEFDQQCGTLGSCRLASIRPSDVWDGVDPGECDLKIYQSHRLLDTLLDRAEDVAPFWMRFVGDSILRHQYLALLKTIAVDPAGWEVKGSTDHRIVCCHRHATHPREPTSNSERHWTSRSETTERTTTTKGTDADSTKTTTTTTTTFYYTASDAPIECMYTSAPGADFGTAVARDLERQDRSPGFCITFEMIPLPDEAMAMHDIFVNMRRRLSTFMVINPGIWYIGSGPYSHSYTGAEFMLRLARLWRKWERMADTLQAQSESHSSSSALPDFRIVVQTPLSVTDDCVITHQTRFTEIVSPVQETIRKAIETGTALSSADANDENSGCRRVSQKELLFASRWRTFFGSMNNRWVASHAQVVTELQVNASQTRPALFPAIVDAFEVTRDWEFPSDCIHPHEHGIHMLNIWHLNVFLRNLTGSNLCKAPQFAKNAASSVAELQPADDSSSQIILPTTLISFCDLLSSPSTPSQTQKHSQPQPSHPRATCQLPFAALDTWARTTKSLTHGLFQHVYNAATASSTRTFWLNFVGDETIQSQFLSFIRRLLHPSVETFSWDTPANPDSALAAATERTEWPEDVGAWSALISSSRESESKGWGVTRDTLQHLAAHLLVCCSSSDPTSCRTTRVPINIEILSSRVGIMDINSPRRTIQSSYHASLRAAVADGLSGGSMCLTFQADVTGVAADTQLTTQVGASVRDNMVAVPQIEETLAWTVISPGRASLMNLASRASYYTGLTRAVTDILSVTKAPSTTNEDAVKPSLKITQRFLLQTTRPVPGHDYFHYHTVTSNTTAVQLSEDLDVLCGRGNASSSGVSKMFLDAVAARAAVFDNRAALLTLEKTVAYKAKEYAVAKAFEVDERLGLIDTSRISNRLTPTPRATYLRPGQIDYINDAAYEDELNWIILKDILDTVQGATFEE